MTNNVVQLFPKNKDVINIEEGFNILLSFAQVIGGMDSDVLAYCEECFHRYKVKHVDGLISYTRTDTIPDHTELLKRAREALVYANENLSEIDGEDDVTAKVIADINAALEGK